MKVVAREVSSLDEVDGRRYTPSLVAVEGTSGKEVCICVHLSSTDPLIESVR